MSTLDVIDLNSLMKLKQIQGDGQPDIVKELADLFFSTTPVRLKNMEISIDLGLGPTVAREAHSLKSGSAYLGATEMSHICAQLENIGRTAVLSDARPLMLQLKSEYEKVKIELENIIHKGILDVPNGG